MKLLLTVHQLLALPYPFPGATTPAAAALPEPSLRSSGEGVWSPAPPALAAHLADANTVHSMWRVGWTQRDACGEVAGELGTSRDVVWGEGRG